VGLLSLFTRRRLPAPLRPALDRDERVVAWASTADSVVVVTNLGLYLPGVDRRLGWHEIHKATWSGRVLTVVPSREVAGGDGFVEMVDLPPVSVTLLDPDRVPEQVRTRVLRSVAYTNHHPVPGGGVRVVARRVPGQDGLSWAVRADPGSLLDPAVVSALVARARSEISGSGSVTPAG
jgi:hypothetical protein